MAVMTLQQAWVEKEFQEFRLQMVAGIVEQQNPDGWFPESSTAATQLGNQDFYPGEALLALGREFRLRPSRVLENVFGSAFSFYERYSRAQRSPFFVSWQVKAWATISESVQDSRYAEFVFRHLDWLGSFQYSLGDRVRREFSGGFRLPSDSDRAMPTFVTAVFTEAFVHGLRLARRVGDLERVSRYGRIVEDGLQFVLRLQVGRELAPCVKNERLAVGGITKDLGSLEMRCDYSAHAITCLVSALSARRECERRGA